MLVLQESPAVTADGHNADTEGRVTANRLMKESFMVISCEFFFGVDGKKVFRCEKEKESRIFNNNID